MRVCGCGECVFCTLLSTDISFVDLVCAAFKYSKVLRPNRVGEKSESGKKERAFLLPPFP